jgi:hypothetical protein
MGLLFTTEGTRRIINTLNSAFDESSNGLAYIKSLATPPVPATSTSAAVPAGPLYTTVSGRNWNPADLAEQLDLLPYDQGNGEGTDGNGNKPPHRAHANKKHAKRWRHFLLTVVGDKTVGVNGKKPIDTIFAPLRSALADAILGTDSTGAKIVPAIVRVSFDHVELDENLDNPGTVPPNIVIFDASLLDDSGNTVGKVRHITLFTVRVPSNMAGSDFGNSVVTPPWHYD